jgi:hypothetical protein
MSSGDVRVARLTQMHRIQHDRLQSDLAILRHDKQRLLALIDAENKRAVMLTNARDSVLDDLQSTQSVVLDHLRHFTVHSWICGDVYLNKNGKKNARGWISGLACTLDTIADRFVVDLETFRVRDTTPVDSIHVLDNDAIDGLGAMADATPIHSPMTVHFWL